jgi:uncharacterized repeat protein (TIGR02543 family)
MIVLEDKMKTIHKISMLLLIAAFSLLIGCEISTGAGEDGFGFEPDFFIVTFNSNGGTPVAPIRAGLFTTIKAPTSPRKGYKFEGWYKDATYTNEWKFDTDIVMGNITLYAKWGDYEDSYTLGSEGPGGGRIFYIAPSPSEFEMEDTKEKYHYLEAAPADMATTLAWASITSPAYNAVLGARGTGIGDGRNNTALILAQDPNAPAAKACKDYKVGGQSDWFLPSRDELKLLNFNKFYVDNLSLTASYWSSSEHSNSARAFYQYFDTNVEGYDFKTVSYSVRAIRAF